MTRFCGAVIFSILARSGAFVLPRGQSGTFMKVLLSTSNESVTGVIYDASKADSPTIRLFTKAGCTLCDKVKDVLASVEPDLPHRLEAVDITDEAHAEWFSKYKYDIPVLHVGDRYWTKHKLSQEEARNGLEKARAGSFHAPNQGEPDAGEMERRQAERESKKSSQ